MVDRDTSSKPEENYPLLKVESGGGDVNGRPQTVVTTISPNWIVRCSPKQSWFTRWPEFFSACWMTLVLLGISFLVFYALGMTTYRRQPIILIKCNDTKPASNVYYHHIVPRGTYIPFILYSKYIADMATRYSGLRLNINFLVDDSTQSTFRNTRHEIFFNKIIPNGFISLAYNSRIDDNNKRLLRDFQRKYENVNITIMPLSKFMAMTPLKYNWRLIPSAYLPFYARIYSIWQHGGIGIDLNTFNNIFKKSHHMDHRILAILKQHNDGIKPNDYTNVINSINRDEETEFFGFFFTMINQILNETRSFLNSSLSFYSTIEGNGTINSTRKARDKRELSEKEIAKPVIEENNVTVNIGIDNATYVKLHNNLNNTFYQIINTELNNKLNQTNTSLTDTNIQPRTKPATLTADNNNTKGTKLNGPRVIMFYDFLTFNDAVPPPYMMSEMISQPDFGIMPKINEDKFTKHYKKSPFLSLNSDGTFIAASSHLHAFLGHILFASAYHNEHPRFAIRDALYTQCYDVVRCDQYCNNIFLLE